MDTTASAVDRWLRERRATGEITSKTRSLLAARFTALLEDCGDMPVSSVDRAAMRRWARRVGHLAPATRRAYLSTIGCFCRWALTEGLLEEDPTKDLARVREPRRAPRARQAAEVGRVFAACPTPRERAIVALMVQMGLRSIEVSRLQMGDWDKQAGTMLIKGKAGHERVLPVPAAVVDELEKYRADIGDRPGPLICDRRWQRAALSPAAVAKLVSTAMREAGVKRWGGDGVTPHTLRHTAASDVLDRCDNVRTVQNMLGQVSLATTQIYLRRASLAQLREAMSGRDYCRQADWDLGGAALTGDTTPAQGDPTDIPGLESSHI